MVSTGISQNCRGLNNYTWVRCMLYYSCTRVVTKQLFRLLQYALNPAPTHQQIGEGRTQIQASTVHCSRFWFAVLCPTFAFVATIIPTTRVDPKPQTHQPKPLKALNPKPLNSKPLQTLNHKHQILNKCALKLYLNEFKPLTANVLLHISSKPQAARR